MGIDLEFIPFLDEMLMELSTERLEVCLVPGSNPEAVRDGKMIRAAISKNVDWYQELCGLYPCMRYKKRNNRKDGTRIKRQYIMLVLERMIRNKRSDSVYVSFLLGVAEARKEMYDTLEREERTELKPWNNQF